MYKKRIVLFNICILLIFSFTFADNNGDKNHFSYKLPLYNDSLMNSIWINAQYSNPSITIITYMLGSSTNQYGGAIGYAQTINNFIKWGVGLGILYGTHEYSSGFNEYNKSISLQLPITFSVGKKGYDYFAFKIGAKVTPFITIQTEEFSDEFTESGTGSNYELTHNDIIPGAHIAILPQFVWYNKKQATAFTLTIFSPGFLYFYGARLGDGLTISTHFTFDFFLKVRDK